ncbi:hypothetical protein [Leptospira licerasiae]|uniref:hypothetical protein n=1 Tax=Leptospira licerasiae TaxID=447106 RepID=UPI003018D193
MKFKKLLLGLIILSLLNCVAECTCTSKKINPIDTSHCPDPDEPLLLPLIDTVPLVKLKAPSDRGVLRIEIQGNDSIILQPEEISNKFIPISYSEGKYYIESSIEGNLLNESLFNFKENLKDGIILRNDFNIFDAVGRCYLFDGIVGDYSRINCN